MTDTLTAPAADAPAVDTPAADTIIHFNGASYTAGRLFEAIEESLKATVTEALGDSLSALSQAAISRLISNSDIDTALGQVLGRRVDGLIEALEGCSDPSSSVIGTRVHQIVTDALQSLVRNNTNDARRLFALGAEELRELEDNIAEQLMGDDSFRKALTTSIASTYVQAGSSELQDRIHQGVLEMLRGPIADQVASHFGATLDERLKAVADERLRELFDGFTRSISSMQNTVAADRRALAEDVASARRYVQRAEDVERRIMELVTNFRSADSLLAQLISGDTSVAPKADTNS